MWLGWSCLYKGGSLVFLWFFFIYLPLWWQVGEHRLHTNVGISSVFHSLGYTLFENNYYHTPDKSGHLLSLVLFTIRFPLLFLVLFQQLLSLVFHHITLYFSYNWSNFLSNPLLYYCTYCIKLHNPATSNMHNGESKDSTNTCFLYWQTSLRSSSEY